MVVSRIQSFIGYWCEGQESLSVACHISLSMEQLIARYPGSIQAIKQGYARQKTQSLCNLISEVTSHHFCHTLSVIRESVVQLTLEGGYTRTRLSRSVAPWGPSKRLPTITSIRWPFYLKLQPDLSFPSHFALVNNNKYLLFWAT